MAMTITQTMTILFGAYGESKDVDRQTIYCKVLKDIPPALLEMAVYKVLGEWEKTYLPPPGVIVKAAKSIAESKQPEKRVKTWGEALEEIEKAMRNTPWGHNTKWSTPEIAKAVNSFGWHNLQTSLEADMPTVRAQLRRLYEDACNRTTEDARNAYLRGENPLGVLGIGDKQLKGLQGVSEILSRTQNA